MSVRVTIQDNGKGFTLPKTIGILASNGKSGILGMKGKALLLGGIFNIKSKLDKATIVSIEFDSEKIHMA